MNTCIFASTAVPHFEITSLKYITKGSLTISRVQRQQERKLDFLKLVTSNSNWFAQYDKDFWEYCTNLTNNPKTHFYTLGFHKSQYDAINFFEYVRQLPIGLIRNDN